MQDRILDAVRKVIREVFVNYDYLGPKEYVVHTQTGTNTYDCQPTDKTLGLPDLPDVAVKPGIPGVTFTLQVGSLVYVEFIDGNPSRPMIKAFGNSDDPNYLPSDIAIDGTTVELAPSGGDVAVASGGGEVILSTPSLIPVGPVPGRLVRYGDPYTVGTPGSTIPLTFAGVAPISKASG